MTCSDCVLFPLLQGHGLVTCQKATVWTAFDIIARLVKKFVGCQKPRVRKILYLLLSSAPIEKACSVLAWHVPQVFGSSPILTACSCSQLASLLIGFSADGCVIIRYHDQESLAPPTVSRRSASMCYAAKGNWSNIS